MKMTPVLCCIVFLFVSMLSAVARQQEKPRVIVTTDGEIDDQSSMIRFLMYSSDYDVAGIVQVNGVQKDGHSKDKWIESQIAKYAECLPNLRKHNPDYPDAEYLKTMYPNTLTPVYEKVADTCDRLEYEGSPMFDDFPDREMTLKIIQDIIAEFPEEQTNPETGNWFPELVSVLVLNEFLHRRIRKKEF